MTDPLTDIENAKGQQDLGVTAHRLYTGARTEGASRSEATLVMYAFFRAMFDSQTAGADDQ